MKPDSHDDSTPNDEGQEPAPPACVMSFNSSDASGAAGLAGLIGQAGRGRGIQRRDGRINARGHAVSEICARAAFGLED
jgi:hypothetical protein